MQKFHKKTFMNKHYFNEGCKWHVTIIIWKLQEGAKRLYCNWYFMINIEVQSNTEFSQTYCACLQKRNRTSNIKRVSNGHIGHQTGIKKTNNIMKEKET